MNRLLLVLFAVLANAVAAQNPPPVAVSEILNEWAPQKLAEYQIPGAVIAVAQLDWAQPLLVGYGYADLSLQQPMDPANSIVRVGSVSKAITASLALIAQEQGKLDLHADLLPELTELPIETYPDEQITAHHLLTFTAGFDEELFGQHFRTALTFPGLERFLENHLPPRFERAGVVSSYNDFQTSILGYLIGKRVGQPFADYAQEHLFQPLGMTDSTFEQVDLPDRLLAGMAVAYDLRDGRYQAYARDYIATTPAAGLYTTAADMARYLEALLGIHPERARVLDDDRWQQHFSRQFAHLPELYAWGYGFAQDQRRGHSVWFKDGQASGFHARVLMVPELGLGVFSAINRNIVGPAGNMHAAVGFNREVGDLILEELFAAPAQHRSAPAPDPGFAADPTAYAGTYRTTVQSRHTFERIITMFDDIAVTVEGNYLKVAGGLWGELRPGLVQWHEGGPHYAGFGELSDSRYQYLFLGRGSYQRVPWYGASNNSRWLAASFAGTACVALLLSFSVYWRRRSELAALIGLHSLLQFGFFLGFAYIFARSDVQQMFFGVPGTLALVLWLPVLAFAVLAAIIWRLIRYRHGALATSLCWVYVGISIATTTWLAYWRLLGT